MRSWWVEVIGIGRSGGQRRAEGSRRADVVEADPRLVMAVLALGMIVGALWLGPADDAGASGAGASVIAPLGATD